MRSVRVSSQLLASVLFIAVPTNAENVKFFLTLVIYHPSFYGTRLRRDLIEKHVYIHACMISSTYLQDKLLFGDNYMAQYVL